MPKVSSPTSIARLLACTWLALIQGSSWNAQLVNTFALIGFCLVLGVFAGDGDVVMDTGVRRCFRGGMARRGWRFWSAGRAGAAVLLAVSMSAAFVVAVLPLSAGAHTSSLVSAEPAPGARVGRPPTQVQLRFLRPSAPDPRTKVAMVSPSGVDLAVGAPAVTGLGVSQRVSPAREVGVYVVSYAVVAVDGHLSRGNYDFLLTAAAPTTSQDGALPVWWWLLLGAGFLGLVVGGSVVLQSQLRSTGRR